MRLHPFPKDFLWGTATASYQVEGAYNEDNRGMSIWDTFSHTPGLVRHGHTGDRACDQYHRYREDVALMADLGVDAYRFSISWPRLFPEGYGQQNTRGFDYYRALIEELLNTGIKPVVTLYHWDLPQRLQDEGGWVSRDTAYRFSEYAESCFKAFGETVDMWITLNEPFCSAILGHVDGIHAPGIQDRKQAMQALHHLLLAHGMATEQFRGGGYEGRIGISLNLYTPRAATAREDDRLAADRAADLGSRMFMDPLFKGSYPERFLKTYPDAPLPVQDGDGEVISGDLDFLGLNYYFEDAVRFEPKQPEQYAVARSWQPRSDMGWYTVPEGLYRQLLWVENNYAIPPLYITENGYAAPDILSDDGLHCFDRDRIEYLRSHLAALSRALQDGVDVRGFFLWSLLDNFEWSFGYTKRFGIVYTDYVDQRRVPKDSYYFYRDLIAGHVAL